MSHGLNLSKSSNFSLFRYVGADLDALVKEAAVIGVRRIFRELKHSSEESLSSHMNGEQNSMQVDTISATKKEVEMKESKMTEKEDFRFRNAHENENCQYYQTHETNFESCLIK